MRRGLHRARIGVRKAGVDYFRGDGSDWLALAGLLVAIPAIAGGTLWRPDWFAPTALVLPVIAGGLLLRPASLLALYAASAAALIVEAALLGPYTAGPDAGHPRHGAGRRGRRVLRAADRAVPQPGRGALAARRHDALRPARTHPRPEQAARRCPEGWHREMALRPAGGQSFSGDFVVASRTHGGHILEVVLTDVSGKGMDAASRALLLSGAFGGLLGSLPPHGFLPAANGYLLRQDWDEGFATSIHLVLDLESGDYELLSAGHLPALQLSAGTGRWEEKSGEGPLLGVYDGAQFDPVKGTLRPGDVLMLFTDGLVEAADRDIAEGIDRLTGEADRYVGQRLRRAPPGT